MFKVRLAELEAAVTALMAGMPDVVRDQLREVAYSIGDIREYAEPEIYFATYDQGTECRSGCQYHREWVETYPQGDQTISETCRECEVPANSLCPAVRRAMGADLVAVPKFLGRQGG